MRAGLLADLACSATASTKCTGALGPSKTRVASSRLNRSGSDLELAELDPNPRFQPERDAQARDPPTPLLPPLANYDIFEGTEQVQQLVIARASAASGSRVTLNPGSRQGTTATESDGQETTIDTVCLITE